MGFFDDNPFGGMFDWDGDGKESFFEQMVGIGSMEHMMNDDDDEPYVAPFGLDLSDDTVWDPDDLGWDEDGLELDEDDTDWDYGETAPEPPQANGEYVWTEINPYAVMEQNKKAEMQSLADNLAAVAAQSKAATQPPAPTAQSEAAARAEERLKQLREQNEANMRLLFWIIAIAALIIAVIGINDLVEDHQKRISTPKSYHSSYTTRKYSYTTRKQSSYTTRKNTYTTRKPYYEQNDPDPYDAKDYGDPDDFYYWHEDDFYDYEDAEEYYYDHDD